MPGDNCTTGVVPLNFGGTPTATASGTTTGYTDDTASALCFSGLGTPDRVYSFNLTSTYSVSATVTSSAFSPVVSIRGPSNTCTALSETACAGPTAGSATAKANSLGAGTYYVWVDGASGSGPFTLSVTGTPPSAGTCASPTPLVFDANRNATASGTTVGATGAISGGPCPPPSGSGAGSGPEVVYSFNQPTTGNFSATLVGSGVNRPVLYLRSTCIASVSKACDAAPAAAGTAAISVPSLPAGDYFLVADSVGGTMGGYTLTASQQVATPIVGGESCSAPFVVALNGTSVLYSSDTTPLVNNLPAASNSCDKSSAPASLGGRDMVFQFVAPRSGLLTVTAATTSGWDLNLSVRSGSVCSSSTEIACEDVDVAPPETANVTVAAGSTYWIWVTGFTEAHFGAFTIHFSLP